MGTFCVYAHIDPRLGIPFYIGKGIQKRAESLSARNTLYERFVKKMRAEGHEPVVQIVYSNLSEEEALTLEVQEIARYGRRNIGTGCLLNLTDGGEGQSGLKHTEETKRKISSSLVGRSWNTGRKLTEEQRMKISETLKSKKYEILRQQRNSR